MKKVIENGGITTERFNVPAFDLNEGEIIVLYLYNGAHFYNTEMFLKEIFCEEAKHPNVLVHKKMTFVEHIKESNFRRIFWPITVGEYLRKNADLSSPFSKKIFEIEWMTNKIKVNTLAGTPRRLLALYAALSKTKNIVFDLGGVDPAGCEFAMQVVQEAVKEGGSAILLDAFDKMKKYSSQFIAIELKDYPPDPKEKLSFK